MAKPASPLDSRHRFRAAARECTYALCYGARSFYSIATSIGFAGASYVQQVAPHHVAAAAAALVAAMAVNLTATTVMMGWQKAEAEAMRRQRTTIHQAPCRLGTRYDEEDSPEERMGYLYDLRPRLYKIGSYAPMAAGIAAAAITKSVM